MAGTARLPGMTDAQIEELDTLAVDYKKWQKKRMAALAKEVEAKDKIFDAMKKHKKRKYVYEDTTIEIITTEEKLKVTVADPQEGDDDKEAA